MPTRPGRAVRLFRILIRAAPTLKADSDGSVGLALICQQIPVPLSGIHNSTRPPCPIKKKMNISVSPGRLTLELTQYSLTVVYCGLESPEIRRDGPEGQ